MQTTNCQPTAQGAQTPTRGRSSALSVQWDGLLAYAFPPISLVSRSLTKIEQEDCRVLLIAPFWPRQPWFPVGCSLPIPQYPNWSCKLILGRSATEGPIRAHDVREVATSLAFFKGVPLANITKVACWKCPNTFSDLYLKDVLQTDGRAGREVLKTASQASQKH